MRPVIDLCARLQIAEHIARVRPSTVRSSACRALAASILVLCVAGCVVPDPRPGDMRTDPNADLLPANYVAPPAARVVRDISYGPAVATQPAHPLQKLDLYLPAAGPAPVLVWLHSGGWTAGDKNPVPPMIMRQVSRAGFAVASVNYRLATYAADGTPINPFPAAILDVKTAIRWLKANAAARGLRADKIIVAGGSAGGHLAAFAVASAAGNRIEPTPPGSLASQNSKVAGLVDIVGPSDLVALSNDSPTGALLASGFMGCRRPTQSDPRTCTDATLARANVAPFLTPAIPPGYFAFGVQDTLVVPATQGAPLAAAWANTKGVDTGAFYDLVENGGHNLDQSVINMRALEMFLDAIVAGSIQ
jgi:acetyl esterase/lipase